MRKRLQILLHRRRRSDCGRKLEAIRAASVCSFPTGDIDELLADIYRGRDADIVGLG